MSEERKYSAIQVFGSARGMNQMGWKGAIRDDETTYSLNMSTTIDGEWKKRKGYVLASTIGTSTEGEVLKLHWHTNENTTQAASSGWINDATEVHSSSGGLTIHDVSKSTGTTILDGESVKYLYPNAADSYVQIASAPGAYPNYDAAAGRLKLFINAKMYYSGPYTTYYTNRPAKTVYIFYFSASFNLSILSNGVVRWKYGTGATEYLEWYGGMFDNWYKIELYWDNTATQTVWTTRFRFFVDGVLYASASPASAVTMSFDANTFWLNSGSAATASPHGTVGGGIENWPGVKFCLSSISSWSDSAVSTYVSPAITGIWSHSTGDRVLLTNASKVWYGTGTSFTACTGTYTMGAVRTSAAEWLGNVYIVDGTNVIKWLDYDDTAVSTITVPSLTENPRFICSYHGHLWIGGLAAGGSGAHSVRCSDIDSASAWTLVNQVFKCRDEVRGMHPYANQLIVGTKIGIEAISGYQPHDFTKTILSQAANCASHWSMKEVPMGETATALLWAGYDGVYMMLGNTIQKISWPINEFWQTLSKTELEECCAVDNKETGEYILSVSDGTGNANNWIITFNYRKQDWSIWKYADPMDCLGWYYNSGTRVLLGSDTLGNVFHLHRGDNDNGRAIDGRVYTKWFDGGMPDQDKDFRKLYFWHDLPGDWNLEVGYSTDYYESEIPANIVVGTDLADWKCIQSHMPDIIVGDNGNDYYCILEHTAAATNAVVTLPWAANTEYVVGALRLPTSPDGHVYRCTTAGTSNSAEPSWDTTHGNTTADGTVVWTNDGTLNYATYWTATGTTGRGQTWESGVTYQSNIEKKPITGSKCLSYWVPNNTLSQGVEWSDTAGYNAARPEFQVQEYVNLGGGGTPLGAFILGTSILGKNKDTEMVALDMRDARGRSLRFMFRNANADEPFSVRGMKVWFTYVPEWPG